ncbi:MAG: hypothetical protein ABR611_16430, partial [Chthoniobacterales bacterium]
PPGWMRGFRGRRRRGLGAFGLFARLANMKRSARREQRVSNFRLTMAGTGMPGPAQVQKQFARWKKILK